MTRIEKILRGVIQMPKEFFECSKCGYEADITKVIDKCPACGIDIDDSENYESDDDEL
mgnify:CR=1 FL=1